MNTNNAGIDQWQEKEALARFQLIAPLLSEDLDDARRMQLRNRIAQEHDISVRTLYRYEGVQHKKVVCILDEAHLLEKETLEEFRFLLNYKFDSTSPMALVLVGQTERYIHSHMLYSGCDREVFTSKAIDEIHKTSVGIPRMINRICEKSLMYAFQQQKRLIDDYMIKYVVEHEITNK